MPLYFAYGASLDRPAFLKRCPRSKFYARARLARHRFAMTADGHATVVRDPHRQVFGILWDLALSDVAALDAFEGAGLGSSIKVVQPVLIENGANRRALLYVRTAGEAKSPIRQEAIAAIVKAAEAVSLPSDYIAFLAGFAGAGRKNETGRLSHDGLYARRSIEPKRGNV